LQESRGQFVALQGLPESERQARIQKNREATRARIREILTPEQRARYDADSPPPGGSGGGRAQVPGRVFVQTPDGKPEPVPLVLGISDGQSTEVVRGELKEGQEVIVGVLGASTPGARANTPTPPQRAGSGPRLRL
jgi:HlyD family secretion protein